MGITQTYQEYPDDDSAEWNEMEYDDEYDDTEYLKDPAYDS